LVHVDTELGAKDLLNNRMAYVTVSRGAHDAQLFTNDREKLPAALGHEVSRGSAHPRQHKQEQSIQSPQQEIAPKHEHSYGMGLGLYPYLAPDGSPAPQYGSTSGRPVTSSS